MRYRKVLWMATVVMSVLMLAACQTESNDVATLKTEDFVLDAPRVEGATGVEDEVLDEEAMMMAFTECLREQGVEAAGPGG